MSTKESINPSTRTPSEDRLDDGQFKEHWVLPAEERAKGFVRPLRDRYTHTKCGLETSMPHSIAETFARDPSYYGSTFCSYCYNYYDNSEFAWGDGSIVGT